MLLVKFQELNNGHTGIRHAFPTYIFLFLYTKQVVQKFTTIKKSIQFNLNKIKVMHLFLLLILSLFVHHCKAA